LKIISNKGYRMLYFMTCTTSEKECLVIWDKLYQKRT